ncbi:MAG: hypothetical protein FWH32_05290 [Clostridiales bacterium]|nr:hypothetical protein [Clostridiales bacterium]
MDSFMLWLRCAGYALVLAFVLAFLFLPGVRFLFDNGNTGLGISLVCVSCFAYYVATTYFLKSVPHRYIKTASQHTFAESFRTLPALMGVFGIFAVAFAVLTGIIAVVVYIVASSSGLAASWEAVFVACEIVLAILTLPFFMRAFAGFAGGEKDRRRLLSASIHIGGLPYVKHLVLGAATIGILELIWLLTEGMSAPMGMFVLCILAAALGGAAILLVWRIHSVKRRGR